MVVGAFAIATALCYIGLIGGNRENDCTAFSTLRILHKWRVHVLKETDSN